MRPSGSQALRRLRAHEDAISLEKLSESFEAQIRLVEDRAERLWG